MLKVGDSVYCVLYSNSHGENSYERVTKVGSKWIYTNTYKIYKLNMGIVREQHGYSDIGKCYKSKEEYEEHLLTITLYNRLKWAIEASYPTVDSNTIRKAADLLGLDLKEN